MKRARSGRRTRKGQETRKKDQELHGPELRDRIRQRDRLTSYRQIKDPQIVQVVMAVPAAEEVDALALRVQAHLVTAAHARGLAGIGRDNLAPVCPARVCARGCAETVRRANCQLGGRHRHGGGGRRTCRCTGRCTRQTGPWQRPPQARSQRRQRNRRSPSCDEDRSASGPPAARVPSLGSTKGDKGTG